MMKETLLNVNPEFAGFEALITDQLLSQILPIERISKLKTIFILAAKNHNDRAAKNLLEVIEKSYGNGHRGEAAKRAEKQFHDYLMGIYWQLPDKKAQALGSQPEERRTTMLQTKFWILEHLISDWKPKMTDQSINVFRFFINAAYPPGKGDPFETIAGKRWVSLREREKILELLRKQNRGFTPEELEEWLQQPRLPSEIEKLLVMARTRNGGPKLWQKDIRNAELVKPLFPDKRSPAAIETHQKFCQEIATLDNELKILLNKMQDAEAGFIKRHEIGASEYVAGTITTELTTDLTGVTISIRLEEGCSKELSYDIHNRARRHIEVWQYGKEKKINITLKTYRNGDNPLQSFKWFK